ncbi:MAG: pullulanase-type alpha-1,6-glucosidase [Bellilinea sp.]
MRNKVFFQVVISLFIIFALTVPNAAQVAFAQDTTQPETVTIAGTMQSELGCSGDWMPGCEKTYLTFDANSNIWKGTFEVTPGNDQDKKGPRYKAALNGSWDENYGKNASQGGADIPLAVDQPIEVTFYYDHQSHVIAEDYNTPIAVAVGDFQTQLGCALDNDPQCLRAWLQDPEGDGSFAFTTKALKAGNYSVSLVVSQKTVTTTADAVNFMVAKDNDEIYFGYDMLKQELIVSTTGAPKGSLAKQKAIWINQDTILWNIVGSPAYQYSLFYSPDAALELTAEGVSGGTEIPLTFSKSGPGGDIFKQNPYLAGFSAFKLDQADFPKLPEILRGQLAVIVRDNTGKVVDSTGLQIAGVLDDLYSYEGKLGEEFTHGIPTLRVWAPTATSVGVWVYGNSTTEFGQLYPMTRDDATGVWSVTGKLDWKNKYYLYEVQVYVPGTGKIETNLVTDPYSFSLSLNSTRSQMVDLNVSVLKPRGWDALEKPVLENPEDSVIYELHVRDFSIYDETVPETLRGKFMAFTVDESDGMQHLKSLAEAGLTHIHLLPAFDIASVNEDSSTWLTVDEELLKSYPADSDQQSQAVALVKGEDGFNWGYDPYHYTVPEGSYATNPRGYFRIREFREMVKALNQNGLRVVMDVVYNHTSQSGQDPKSVLDKIVPGYYYRLNLDGNVETSTCCQNTATEHRMMEKLMVDSVVTWATQYKVDGFRFDLMGHHMLTNMEAVRAALDNLKLEKDGVDGKAITIYGEGWDFGEVAKNAHGINATQLNIGGTGIGVFNDRLRDGARGGNPFDDPRLQGFTTGLYINSNAAEARKPEAQLDKLLDYTDWIRLGLAGNLKNYILTRSNGSTADGAHVYYNGVPAGYTLDPQENIVYVSAHDNETIFDAVQLKAAANVSLAERIRMNNLALSIPMFSQGIPFFHAGDDLLRSKSLDKNSYDSGDWFNKLDWTFQTNNWGVGLPIEGSDRWDIYRPLLSNRALEPSPTQIASAAEVFKEFLQIRMSSPLFRLTTGEEVSACVSFFNAGPEQTPGLIVMKIEDVNDIDPAYDQILVFFNANRNAIRFSESSTVGQAYVLHPILANSVDAVVKGSTFDLAAGEFSIPGLTTSVFVLED